VSYKCHGINTSSKAAAATFCLLKESKALCFSGFVIAELLFITLQTLARTSIELTASVTSIVLINSRLKIKKIKKKKQNHN